MNIFNRLLGKLRGAGKGQGSFWRNHYYVRTLDGGVPVFRKRWIDRSRYMPHQGHRECERRMA